MSTPETIVIFVLVTVFFFLLVREVICWYFKINKRVELLTEILAAQKTAISLEDKNNV